MRCSLAAPPLQRALMPRPARGATCESAALPTCAGELTRSTPAGPRPCALLSPPPDLPARRLFPHPAHPPRVRPGHGLQRGRHDRGAVAAALYLPGDRRGCAPGGAGVCAAAMHACMHAYAARGSGMAGVFGCAMPRADTGIGRKATGHQCLALVAIPNEELRPLHARPWLERAAFKRPAPPGQRTQACPAWWRARCATSAACAGWSATTGERA